MKRESIDPVDWGLKFGMDQGEVVAGGAVEGGARHLRCSGQVAVVVLRSSSSTILLCGVAIVLAIVLAAAAVSAESRGAPEPVAGKSVRMEAGAAPVASRGKTDPALARRVQSDIRQMMTASYASDPEAVLRYTHPAIIESMGGTTRAREEVGKALDKMKQIGLSVESFEFPAEPRFVRGKKRLFAVVPTKIVVKAGAQRAEVESFQVGIREDGGDAWTYVEGAKFAGGIRAKLFPDFPADYEFPPVSRAAL